MRRAVALPAVLALAVAVTPRAAGPQSIGVAASGDSLPAWADRVDAMLAEGTLGLAGTEDDTQIAGRVHERLNQLHDGRPVFGGQTIRQLDGRRLVSVLGRLYEHVDVEMTPAIEAAAAADAAVRAQGADAVVVDEAELGVLPLDTGGYALAYRMTVRSAWDRQIYYVDARSGRVRLHFSTIETQVPGSAVGRGTGVLGDAKKVSANRTSSTFQALDTLRPASASTLDFLGSQTRLGVFLQNGRFSSSDIAADADNVWTDPGEAAIVDAHVYQGFTYDYYFKRFGRRGLDDRNIPIVGVIHPLARADQGLYDAQTRATFINNAAYLGAGYIFYGDGDGRALDYLAGGLDIVGHELTHGVTDFTSKLTYRDESGALNEAFSDIMGTAIEFFYQPAGSGRQRADWTIGEDVALVAPGFIRSLANPQADPNRDPDHYSLLRDVGTTVDNGGVHENSTVVSHAFYLAVMGGQNRVSGLTVAGVGLGNIERMERIFYRAWAFLMGPDSRFTDARAATLQAATDLYGATSNERAQVTAAWDAVGVR